MVVRNSTISGPIPTSGTTSPGVEQHSTTLAGLRDRAPKKFGALVQIEDELLPQLAWQQGSGPASEPDGNPFEVVFINRGGVDVELFWLDRQGEPKSYGLIGAGEKRRQQTRPGAVWQIAAPGGVPVLGHFVVDDRAARAVIPKI